MVIARSYFTGGGGFAECFVALVSAVLASFYAAVRVWGKVKIFELPTMVREREQ